MRGGLLHQPQSICPACNGSGTLAEPVEERFGGYLDGAEPAARLWLVRVDGVSGLGADDDKAHHLFSSRFLARERESLRDMEDGLIIEHVARLRRVLVMAEEDRLPDWYVDLIRQRHAIGDGEVRWRKRAETKGGDRVAAGIAWRERVDRLRGSVDLAMLIAYENDKATPVDTRGWRCCCPFHPDREPSLDIDTVKRVWICRGCNVGGDAFTYVELRYGLDFAGAVRHLEGRL